MDARAAWSEFIAYAREVAARGVYRDETPDELRDAFAELAKTDFLNQVFGLDGGSDAAPYLLYKDPDYGFSVRAVTMKPRQRGGVHDHGRCWALYAGYRGETEMEVFARLDDGSRPDVAQLEVARRVRVGEGDAAAFPSYAIHRPTNVGDDPAVIVNLYSEDLADVARHRYDLDAHRAIPYHGSGIAGADEQVDLMEVGAAAAWS